MNAVWWLLGGHPGAEGHLDWQAPQWVVLVVGAAALLAWGLSLRGERSLPARLAEALLWGLALAGLVVALAQPVWLEEEGRQEPGRVAVLVDASKSMGVLEGGKPRSDQAEALLGKLDSDQVDYYHFGDDLAVGRPGKYDLPGTDLEGALSALSERVAGEKLAGIVVVTDGLDRGLLRKRFLEEKQPDPVRDLPGPLTIYQVGSPGTLKDLSVRSVDAGGYAFVRTKMSIKAHISGIGYEGRSFTASLLRDGAPIGTAKVTLDKAGQGEASFDVIPDSPGRFTYTVTVPVYADDAVPANNAMPIVVGVVRDRLRVLQVAGAPTWDVKFLRRFLKGDPSVDLVSFFILRTNDDLDAGYDENELSLIPFPTAQLFTQELHTFDLVIFQNFDYEPYFESSRASNNELLGNVAKFVTEEGKAFAMIGGDRSFDLGKYAGTPIGDILPVKLGVPSTPSEPVCQGECDPTPFSPVLTADGERHPITRLAPDPKENLEWWGRLHPADGTNLTLGPADGAAVLLEHPTLKTADGKPMPILAVKEAGKGRSMALTIDASWRWSFSEAAAGRGNQAYLRFWKNAFHWLVGDPTASRVTVETPRENYGIGDTVRIVVRARDPGFAPLPKAKVVAKLTGDGVDRTLDGWTGPDGEVALEWPADVRGAHRVSVTVSQGDAVVGTADTVFAVTTRDPELDEVIPDEAFLQWVAKSTNGQYYGPGQWGPYLRDEKAGRTVWDRRETPLWRAPLFGLWVGLFAGLAWIVRRRAGLR